MSVSDKVKKRNNSRWIVGSVLIVHFSHSVVDPQRKAEPRRRSGQAKHIDFFLLIYRILLRLHLAEDCMRSELG